MFRALIIDDDSAHAERLSNTVASRGLHVDLVRDENEAINLLRDHSVSYELAIVNVSCASREWPLILGQIQEACWQAGRYSNPLMICVSDRRQEPQIELAVERQGARFVCEG